MSMNPASNRIEMTGYCFHTPVRNPIELPRVLLPPYSKNRKCYA